MIIDIAIYINAIAKITTNSIKRLFAHTIIIVHSKAMVIIYFSSVEIYKSVYLFYFIFCSDTKQENK